MIIIKTSEAVRESTRSNVNEAIRAILNFFIFFLQKYFTRTKSTKITKSMKSIKSTKSTKRI